MSMFDEVLCNHDLFGEHKGETHQTKDLHCLGGLLEQYEITSCARLEFLEYRTEDRSDPNAEGWERFKGAMTVVFTGGRRDMNYHGWLYLSCFGRAKFTEGTLVAFEPEQYPPNESENSDEADEAEQDAETGVKESHSIPEAQAPVLPIYVGRTFRRAQLPCLNDLEAFIKEIEPDVRMKLAWLINKSLGLETYAVRQLLKDKSIAEEWLRFEQEAK